MANNNYLSFRNNAAGLEDAMRQGRTVRFKYRKQNGSIRHAYGRFPKRLAEDMGIDGNVFLYWDVERSDWRSFLIRNLL